MAWQGILGVDEIALQFARANRRRRLGGSFLFVGPAGVGKRSFAFALAKTLLCSRHFLQSGDAALESDAAPDPVAELERFQPCGECENCKQFEWSVDPNSPPLPTHPDFHYVCKPADKSLLPLEALIGDKDARMRSGLCFELNQTAFMGGRKIAVVDDADFFNLEGANALLKTLEEPPPNTIIFLIGTSAAKQLPTIRSRCQTFRFNSLSNDALAAILLRQGKVETQEEADAVARLSAGSLEEAEKALDAKFSEFQQTLFSELARRPIRGVEFAVKLCEFVDAAGKEAVLRRRRLQNVFKESIAFFRAAFLALEEPTKIPQGKYAPFVRRIVENGGTASRDMLDCVDLTLDAMEKVDRNVNLPYVAEAWAYDLAAISR
ncbi:MAG: hypothetical protein IJM54_09140 [Thermoguttaceae bacterium]|nr:hypothetical protein [Thermoguttaceae bacterium]